MLSNIKVGVELLLFRWIFHIDLAIWTLKKKDNKLLSIYLTVTVGTYTSHGGKKWGLLMMFQII